MEDSVDQLWMQVTQTVGPYAPRVGAALAILVVGWIIALVVRRAVWAAMRRTELDNRLAAWLQGERGATKVDVEGWISGIVYYLLMLFVFVAVFQTLGLTIVTEPLNGLLNRVFAFGPQLLGAIALLALAWAIATVVRAVVSRALQAIHLDERVAQERGEGTGAPLSRTISETAYWLVFLLFLPGILGALSLDGMLAPFQLMIAKLTGFLPNLFTAAVTLAIGWFVARVVQRIVSSLLAALGADAFSKRVGLERAIGGQSLAKLVGMVVHFLIFIPVLIASLSALGLESVANPVSAMLATMLAALPKLLAAALVLAISYVVARLVKTLVENLLAGMGFNSIPARLGVKTQPTAGESSSPSRIVGTVVMVAIMLFAAAEAASLLEFEALSLMVANLIVFGGHLVLGLIILGIGLFLSDLAARAILRAAPANASVLATVARIAILVLTTAMGLRQMGLADDIINLAFGLTLGAAAIAFAIAFGLGGRELASRQLSAWSGSMASNPSSIERAQSGHA